MCNKYEYAFDKESGSNHFRRVYLCIFLLLFANDLFASDNMPTKQTIKHSAIKYSLISKQWRVEMVIDADGRSKVSSTETFNNEELPIVLSSKQLSLEQRLQLIQFIKSTPTVSHKSRMSDTAALFTTEKGSVQWNNKQLLSDPAKEFRKWIEATLHPVLIATQLAYQRGKKADAKQDHATSALAYQEGLVRLSNWWKPTGLKDDTNVKVLMGRKAMKALKYVQARAIFLKVLDERMTIYQEKYANGKL